MVSRKMKKRALKGGLGKLLRRLIDCVVEKCQWHFKHQLLKNFEKRVGLVEGFAFDPAMLGSPAERCSNSHGNGLTRRLRCSGQHR